MTSRTKMTKVTSVLLVDDHPIVREGLRRLLAAYPEFALVAETAYGKAAVEWAEQLRPDLAIVDLLLPDLNGVEVIRRIVRVSPQTRVVALSMYSDELHLMEALRAGATGYIVKGAEPALMLMTLREALAGRRFLTPPLTDLIVQAYTADTPPAPRKADRYALLTDREREVLEMLARGMSYDEIGEQLTISPRTAETHRTNLMRKLDLKTQTDVMLYAVQRGLIDPAQG
jgi:two-component system, NarL family, response regulator NreC